MGAETFVTFKTGKTADEAFRRAVADAQYDYGHAGYTGTIAEKDSFVMIVPPAERWEHVVTDHEAAEAYAYDLIDEGDPRVDDKWGPAGCIDLGPSGDGKVNMFMFFGWASS